MILPADGAIGMIDVTQEFLAPVRTPLTEFVRGGEYVPDMGTGFPNENVPTTPPIALTDMYDATRNPNPVQLEDGILVQPEVEVISSSREGLFVAGYDGIVLPIPSDARFVVDVKFKCGPTFDPYDQGDVTSAGPNARIYPDCLLNADVLIGLTGANPLFATDGNMMSQFGGMRVRFWNSLSSFQGYGPGVVNPLGESPVWLDTVGGGDTSYNDVRPDPTSFTRLRLSRGESLVFNGFTGTWNAMWNLKIYRDDFTTLWREVTTVGTGGVASPYNASGYLIFANNNPTGDGDVDVSFEYLRGFVGGSVPPW
jgi:hypothetical protein